VDEAVYQVMPDLSADEFEQLKSDIAARGVMVPVEYDDAGNVLDVKGFNQDRSKMLSLTRGIMNGYWKVSLIDIKNGWADEYEKEIATSRLPFYAPLHEFSLAPSAARGKTLMNNCVYFIYAPAAKLVKIGTTRGNADARMKQMCTISPVRLLVIGSIPGDFRLEKELHGRFARQRHHGEWFAYSGELKDYIDSLFTAEIAK